MNFELDHLFICTSLGAPEGDRLIEFGFSEGTPNQHPGQGTANRRFSFMNAMIELLWVSNPAEAQSQNTQRTLLWKRWSGRNAGASPFGICLRPTHPQTPQPPFPGWKYKPEYLPPTLALHIAEAGIQEPMWIYMDFTQRSHREHHFAEQANGAREITALTLTTPTPLHSLAAQKDQEEGILQVKPGSHSLLEIELDKNRQKKRIDLTPALPIVLVL